MKAPDEIKIHQIEPEDYLDLWKNFNERMTTYKQNMISIITWMTAFAFISSLISVPIGVLGVAFGSTYFV